MSDTTILYGIKNCDSVKKARKWLDSHNISYHFHDFRAEGLNKDLLQAWLDELGAANLINNRSMTWKQLNEKDQQLAMGLKASAVVLANPALIKRPVLVVRDTIVVGLKLEEYEQILLT